MGTPWGCGLDWSQVMANGKLIKHWMFFWNLRFGDLEWQISPVTLGICSMALRFQSSVRCCGKSPKKMKIQMESLSPWMFHCHWKKPEGTNKCDWDVRHWQISGDCGIKKGRSHVATGSNGICSRKWFVTELLGDVQTTPCPLANMGAKTLRINRG